MVIASRVVVVTGRLRAPFVGGSHTSRGIEVSAGPGECSTGPAVPLAHLEAS
jgi:hypothetical protein